MHILLTGGAGFVGSHVAEQLLTHGHQVTVVDDLSTGRRGNLPDGVALHPCSLLDADLAALCTGCDAVIHAAAQTSVAAAVQEPAGDALTNVVGTVRTVTAAMQSGVHRFLFISSAAIYGAADNPPLDEARPAAPTSPYGLSKLAGELYVRLLAEASGMEWVILRLANVYGPRQSATGEAGVVARWTAALAAGEPIHLHGDGGQTRDFIYVGDVAKAAALAVESPGASGRTLNIGTGCQTAVRELLASLEELTGRQAQVSHEPPRPGDIYHSALDPSVARQALGWAPHTPLREGLARTVAWAASGSGR